MKAKNNSLFRCGVIVTLSLLIAACPSTNIFAVTYDPIIPDGQTPYVKNTDGTMIPDKYNTGVDPSVTLTEYRPSDGYFTINGLVFRGRADMNEIQLDFAHTADIEDGATYVIENVDFSDSIRTRFVDYQRFGNTNKKVNVIFKNSKFSTISNEEPNRNYHYEFYDCEFNDAAGYNMDFVRAKFHPIEGDAMNPHGFVSVKDSYMYTKADPASGTRHLDGFQTFGRAAADMEHVSFYNVRVEIPKTKAQKANGEWFEAYVNAAAMLAVEYSESAHDVSLEKMILNGGGWTIYITCADSCQSFTNFTFKDVKVGYGHIYGKLYEYRDTTVDRAAYDAAAANIESTPALYAGSAWKNSAGVHLSVTNDITEERVLTCSVDGGATTTHRIAAHPVISRNATAAELPLFDDLPYDLDIVVADANASSVDCYDTTDDNNLATAPLVRSIRFDPTTTTSIGDELPVSPATYDSGIALMAVGAGAFAVVLYSLIVKTRKTR